MPTTVESADLLRAFLAGDDTHRRDPINWGGPEYGLPLPWGFSTRFSATHLEMRRGKRVLSSLPLSEVAGVVHVSVISPWAKYPTLETWLMGRDGQPVALLPWARGSSTEAAAAGVSERRFGPTMRRRAVALVWPRRRYLHQQTRATGSA